MARWPPDLRIPVPSMQTQGRGVLVVYMAHSCGSEMTASRSCSTPCTEAWASSSTQSPGDTPLPSRRSIGCKSC